MLKPGDLIILVILIAILLVLLLYKSSRMLVHSRGSAPSGPVPKKGDVVNLLDAFGYEMISGKSKIPIDIQVDERSYQSRLFVDGLAQKNGKNYVVRVGSSRKPLRLAGAAIRDELLPYHFIYQADGILYLDMERERVREITFNVNSFIIPRKTKWWPYIVSMAAGAWIAFIFLK